MRETFAERAVRILNRRDSIETISAIAREKVDSEISIGFPKFIKEKNKVIYFIINTPNLDTIDLKTTIKNTLEFDYENDDDNEDVMVLNEQLHSSQTISTFVEDVTQLTPENYDNIQKFLKRHYPECYQEANAVAHQDKRQRSASPARGSSFFPRNGNLHQDEVKLPTEQMMAELFENVSLNLRSQIYLLNFQNFRIGLRKGMANLLS